MSETYEVTYDGAPVGKAQMEKQGLYYAFSCRCQLPDAGLYRIHVICGDHREDLGICVPMDGVFGMDKKLPVRQVGVQSPAFELVPKDWKPPVVPVDEPVIQAEEEEPEVLPVEEAPLEPEMEEMIQTDFCGKTFIPVTEEEPFDHLDKLDEAVMDLQEGQAGIVIPEME